jgi:hypothetical protein
MSTTITRDQYFNRNQPAKSDELVNVVIVPIKPLTLGAVLEKVFESKEITLAAGGTQTIEALFSKKPAIDCAAEFGIVKDKDDNDLTAGMTVTSETYYATVGTVVVHNAAGVDRTFKLVVMGWALTAQGDGVATASDAASMRENGKREYTYPANNLIQSPVIAQLIADDLLESYKTPRKDTEIEWVGNPALELSDEIVVPEYVRGAFKIDGNFRIVRNKHAFDGAYRCTTEGRKFIP